MGWKEGDSLGKDAASGIVEPVRPQQLLTLDPSPINLFSSVQIQTGIRSSATAGLGSALNVTQSLERANDRRTQVWLKTMDRFERLADRDPT